MGEILTLRCSECENPNCVFARKYIIEGSLEGCTRRVSDEVYDKYFYYLQEKWPLSLSSGYKLEYINETYKEIMDFLCDEIYSAPIGQKLNKQGKIKLTN